jgi:hypothetical protein
MSQLHELISGIEVTHLFSGGDHGIQPRGPRTQGVQILKFTTMDFGPRGEKGPGPRNGARQSKNVMASTDEVPHQAEPIKPVASVWKRAWHPHLS